MIAELLEDPDIWGIAVFTAIAIAWWLLRLRHRHRVVDTRAIRSLGTYGGLSLYLNASPGGRLYASLEYQVESEDTFREVEVLFSSRQAAALAHHLKVAAYPHASLTYARAAVRRERA